MSDNMVTIFYIHKHGRVKFLPLCMEVWSVYETAASGTTSHISATYLPCIQNSLAYNLSRLFSTDHVIPSWTKSSPSGECWPGTWRSSTYTFRAALGNTLMLSWTVHLRYVFPPISVLPQVLQKISHDKVRVILIASNWPKQFWFLDLLGMSTYPSIIICRFLDLLTQVNIKIKHPNLDPLHLMA